jgi:hypothetical protein
LPSKQVNLEAAIIVEKNKILPPITLEMPERPVPMIPKSRPIAPEQLGLKTLYPPENSTNAGKIDVE